MDNQYNLIQREDYALELLKTQIENVVITAKEFKRIRDEKIKNGEEVIKDIPYIVFEFVNLAADVVCDEISKDKNVKQ